MMENHSYSDVIGNSAAPYINSLADSGALFTRSFAVTHPSQPNYIALFAGSTLGVTSDDCPTALTGPNLASQLASAGRSFAGYSEDLPQTGFTGCSSAKYARKHAPWVNFADLPTSMNRPLTDFPSDFSTLPSVAFVIPNLQHDMHDGTVAEGDSWLRAHLDAYTQWAKSHDSLLVVTWDEDDHSESNQIPTIVVGAHVKSGRYAEPMTHYRLLRTIEALKALPGLSETAGTKPVTDIWAP